MQVSNCFIYAFHVSTHFLHHIFSKMLFLLEWGTHSCETTSSDLNQTIHFFDPHTASIKAFFEKRFTIFALLRVPIAIFSLHALFKILLLAAVPCIFRPESPVSKNECMHRCNIFDYFSYDLPFSLCLPCIRRSFPKYCSQSNRGSYLVLRISFIGPPRVELSVGSLNAL